MADEDLMHELDGAHHGYKMHAAWLVKCPKCGAKPKVRCVDQHFGHNLMPTSPHPERLRLGFETFEFITTCVLVHKKEETDGKA